MSNNDVRVNLHSCRITEGPTTTPTWTCRLRSQVCTSLRNSWSCWRTTNYLVSATWWWKRPCFENTQSWAASTGTQYARCSTWSGLLSIILSTIWRATRRLSAPSDFDLCVSSKTPFRNSTHLCPHQIYSHSLYCNMERVPSFLDSFHVH